MSATDWLLVTNTVLVVAALAAVLVVCYRSIGQKSSKSSEFEEKLLKELSYLTRTLQSSSFSRGKDYKEVEKEFLFFSKRIRAASIDLQGFIHLAARYLVWVMPEELTEDMGTPPWQKPDDESS